MKTFLALRVRKSRTKKLELVNFGIVTSFITDNRFLISLSISSPSITLDVSRFLLLILAKTL